MQDVIRILGGHRDSIAVRFRQLVADERGDIPIGTILVIALVVIPLLLLLIFYRKEVITWFEKQWAELVKAGG